MRALVAAGFKSSMLSARRVSGVVLSLRMPSTRFLIDSRSFASAASGYVGLRPWRYSTQSFFGTRAKSSGRCDQYQTSNAPTFHGRSRQPYHPSLPYMDGYSVFPLDVRTFAFTAFI